MNTIRRGRGQVRPCDRVRPDDATIVTRLDCAILRAAAAIAPTNLRSLDAIHLATAMSLGQDLAGIVTYDQRLAEAAISADVEVWAPA